MTKPYFKTEEVIKRRKKSYQRGQKKGAGAAARRGIYKKWAEEAAKREAERAQAQD
jgi:hypothetical protein